MIRIVVAGLVVAGLALGIWLLWPDGDAVGDTATTIAAAPETTTTTVSADPTTTPPEVSTTSTVEEFRVVETVEEAEEILRELWFGWFEGIYNQDEERIREVVATEERVETARSQFGVAEFLTAPEAGHLIFEETEILRADEECLAVWAIMAVSGFRTGATSGVFVIRRADGQWLRLTTWASPNDLWEADCESIL